MARTTEFPVLARALRRLPGDYLAVHRHRVVAVETFTDPSRRTGACYAAASFTAVGQTLGYGRSAGRYRHHGNVKRVWIRPALPPRHPDPVRAVRSSAAGRGGYPA